MAEGNGELDVSAGPTGLAVRTKGYRLMDLAWMGSVIGIGYIVFMVSMHDAAAGKEMAAVAQALKESNKEVATTLKESTRESTQILKEMARATREQNCLLSMKPDQRAANSEMCKRISR